MSTNLWTAAKWNEVEQTYLNRKGIKINIVFKRLFDALVSGILCLILLPVLASIALAVKLTSPGPILFRQQRLGKLGKNFQIYKFRTMVDGAVKQGAGLSTFKDDPRITRIGKVLREYHLDELPQIFNVLLGNMSLVGPRPVMPSALPTYSEWERRRLLMQPGITGLQQTGGGETLHVDDRIKLDVWYVENWNFLSDIAILLKTIPVVLTKDGVYGTDGWKIGRGDAFAHSQDDTQGNTLIPQEELEKLRACLKEAAGIIHRHTPIGESTSIESLEKVLTQQVLAQYDSKQSLVLTKQ